MKNNIINALIGILIIGVVLGVTLWYMAAPDQSYMQGQVDATQINVASKIPGRVDEIFVIEGQDVKKGDILMQIGTPEIDAQLSQAEALERAAQAVDNKVKAGARKEEVQAAYNMWQQAKTGMDLAKSTYDRVQNLYDEKVIPAQKRDEAYAQYKASMEMEKVALSNYTMVKEGAREEDKQAALAIVQQTQGAVKEADLYKSEGQVKAPRDGQVLTIMPNAGEIVNSGYPLVNLVDLDDVWVFFNVREDLMPHFKMHTQLPAIIPGLGNQEVMLEVRYIAAQGDYATWSATKTLGDFDMKTFLIKAYPTTKVEGLRPGMSALVDQKNLK
ncbi:HlyD family secretion protein [Myroides sp. LJL116]